MKKISFSVNNQDVRGMCSGAATLILQRFQSRFVEATKKLDESLKYSDSKDILKNIDLLMVHCREMANEFTHIVPLLEELKEEHLPPNT